MKRALLALVVLAGCGDDSPPDGCRFLDSDGQPDDRVVEIGTLVSGTEPIEERFTPWADEDEQTLILGFQGGWMVQPTLRINALADDPASLCTTVRLSNESDARVESGLELARESTRVGDHHYFGPINNLLNDEVDGLINADLTVDVQVITERYSSGDAVTVRLTGGT
ncbi:MAG: hypothetical protein AAGE52_40240 [Myxococcota bacterium]